MGLAISVYLWNSFTMGQIHCRETNCQYTGKVMFMVHKHVTTVPLTSISVNSHCMASDLKNPSPVMITF